MFDRKAELEKKKAKLQAFREVKERRRKEKETKDAKEAAQRTANVEKDQRKELDDMLSSLRVAPVSDVLSSLPSVASTGTPEHNSNNATPDTSLTNTVPIYSVSRKKPQLSVVSVQSTSIPPKVMVTYTKQTQTTNATNERDGAIPHTKEWSYLRDVWWPNARKATMEKIDNEKTTGTGGGKENILTDLDDEVILIIGKDTPSITGLNVTESMEPDHFPTIRAQEEMFMYNLEPPVTENLCPPDEIVRSDFVEDKSTYLSASDEEEQIPCGNIPQQLKDPCKKNTVTVGRVTKKCVTGRGDAIEEKGNLQIELLKIQIYKSQLESRQLEIQMGMPHSNYTKDIKDSVVAVICEEEQ